MTKPADTQRVPLREDFFDESLTARELVALLIEDEKHSPLAPESVRYVSITIL